MLFQYFSNPAYHSITPDRSLLFETTFVNAIAKVGARNHLLRKLTSIKLNAQPYLFKSTALAQWQSLFWVDHKKEVFWVIFLLETNLLKALIFLSSAIMNMKSYCFQINFLNQFIFLFLAKSAYISLSKSKTLRNP